MILKLFYLIVILFVLYFLIKTVIDFIRRRYRENYKNLNTNNSFG